MPATFLKGIGGPTINSTSLLPESALERTEVRPQQANFNSVELQNRRCFLVDQQQDEKPKNWHKAKESQNDAENGSMRLHGQPDGENCCD